MQSFVQTLVDQMAQMSPLEALAVLLAIAYLVLAIRQNIWCWAAAAFSTAIYIYLFHSVALLMESVLNVFYLLMAGYGFYQWRHGGRGHEALAVCRWPARVHLLALTVVSLLTFATGSWLAAHSEAAWPFLDSATTWGAVWATFLTTRKVLENWWYWLLIDAVSVFLYLDRGLPLTALLFVFYLALIPVGYLTWRNTLDDSNGEGQSEDNAIAV